MRPLRIVSACLLVVTTGLLSTAAGASGLSLRVEPAEHYSVMSRAITGARHSIELEMYELADPAIERDLVAAAGRGVQVRVVLDRAYSGGYVNQGAYARLAAGRVGVHWANASVIYHAKFLVVDAHTLIVSTGNLEARWYATTRDFTVVDTNAGDVAAATRAFNQDYSGVAPTSFNTSTLLFSPGSEGALVSLINSAKHTISIENEEMREPYIIAALVSARRRGVVVDVTMTASASSAAGLGTLEAAGVSVHLDHGEYPIYVHAKAICVDCVGGRGRAFVGSENFSVSSLLYNRELGVITTDPGVIGPLERTLVSDFNAA